MFMTPKKIKTYILTILVIFSILAFLSCASTQPGWVKNPYVDYNNKDYFAVVGRGNSYDTAEKDALRRLVSIFNQNVQFDETVYTSYQQVLRSGGYNDWAERTVVDTLITSSTGMDSLVGAEFGNRWDDGKDYAALVFLNKVRAIQAYTNLINANKSIIDNLTNMPQDEKNTLNALARYNFAANAADMISMYSNVLAVIGVRVEPYKNGNEYRQEVRNISKMIPIGISVDKDMTSQIRGAFTKALNESGFQIGGNNPPYFLNVAVFTEAMESDSDSYKYTRISVSADLVDTNLGTILFPVVFPSVREGHISIQTEADKKAYMAMVAEIETEYPQKLDNYLSQQLMPKRY